jgi:hypothetical protein
MAMNRSPQVLVGLAIAVASLLPLRAEAQDPPPPLDCRAVEAIGNTMRDEILAEINATLSDEPIEISRRKSIFVREVVDIRFEGCRLFAKAAVELERKVRRDADGHAFVTGTVASMSLRPARQLCLDRKPKVQRMELSNTLNIGERIYTRVANKVYPPGRCFPG